MLKKLPALKFARLAILAAISIALIGTQSVQAINLFYKQNDIVFYSDTQPASCSTSSGSTALGTDYTGAKIVNDTQMQIININKPTYVEAANAENIPWQLIATIHLRETGLKRINPSNGQGIYQLTSLFEAQNSDGASYRELAKDSGGRDVDNENFKAQTKIAAKYIKGKAASNYTNNRTLNSQASADVIKDTLFSYNGRASVYKEQAAGLGYDKETQGFEGSPYVMNRADAKRDSSSPESSGIWGQIKRDYGPIEYPANRDYGAFVVYSALAGVSAAGCSSTSVSGSTIEKVVQIAEAEYQSWESGSLRPGDSFKKYTGNAAGNWCAWFVSWVYNEAGYPISTETRNGEVPAVQTIWDIGVKNERFEYHDKAGYTPKVGDLVIKKSAGSSHVNIVISVDPSGKIVTIGGNESGNSGLQGAFYLSSRVQKSGLNDPAADAKLTGFVTMKAQ